MEPKIFNIIFFIFMKAPSSRGLSKRVQKHFSQKCFFLGDCHQAGENERARTIELKGAYKKTGLNSHGS